MQIEQKQQENAPSTPPARWIRYRGTYVVMAMMFIVLVLINYAGRIERVTNVEWWSLYTIRIGMSEACLYGWPCTYLQRPGDFHGKPGQPAKWRARPGRGSFSSGFLAVNALLGVLLLGLAAAIYEFWRRQRARFCQLTLLDMFVLLTLASLIGGYVTAHHLARQREQAAVDHLRHALHRSQDGDVFGERDESFTRHLTHRFGRPFGGSPTWDETLLAPFNYVVSLYAPANELQRLEHLPHLRILYLEQFTVPDQAVLEQLAHLEALVVESGDEETMPSLTLRRLRGLRLQDCRCDSRSFANLPALEGLAMNHCEWQADVADALRGAPQLKYLTITKSNLTDDNLASLPSLTQLKGLDLTDNKITDRSLPILKQLTGLRELYLLGNEISPEGKEELRQALPDCDIL